MVHGHLRFLLVFSTLLLSSLASNAQDTLFDQTHVYSVSITIPADSLEVIMTDVLSDHYFMARFIYDYGTGADTVENVGFRLRGNTSRYSQKKSFKISFNEYAPGRRFMGAKKINLNGQHNDPTMVREKLFYDIWNKSGMPARCTSFVRLYINHSYYGLYTNLEEFDKDWLERSFGENAGNLYKCTYPTDLVYHGPDQQYYKNLQSSAVTGGRAYDLQTNEAEDDYSDLVGLITVLHLPADTSFVNQVPQKLDVGNVLKAYAIDVATGNWDDYFFNKNNYYLYDRQPAGQFFFISYDCDNTFGVDWFGIDWTSRDCLLWYETTEPRPLITKLLSVPQFNDLYRHYLDTIAKLLIFPDSIFPHIDSLMDLVEVAALQDTYRTLDYGYDISDFYNGFTETVDSHTPFGIKPFLSRRYQYIMEQLHPAAIEDEELSRLTVYPNPASTRIHIRGDRLQVTSAVLLDMQGRVIMRQVLKGTSEIDVSALPRGMYFLKADSGQRSFTTKVVLQ